ncbi:hypothetical protein EYC84_006205 [Monilinia fructicola]|uniref:CFEM domain-containing protein n=1 Tax=Monilinia fructicola TaxID=38448 RepID=A0A5M9K7J6_MONFR|nr:hypothetical protein EYC84_006205 [Monilinia fructicola]
MSIETELQDPLIEEVGSPIAKSGSEKNTKTSSKKRKRGGIQDQEVPKQKVNEPGKRRKHAPFDEEDVDVEAGLNNSISKMNDHLLVDYVARQTRRYESDLSSVELEDRYLPVSAVRDTTSWTKQRSLDNLPEFLEKFSGNPTKLWSASKKNGSPHTIIVTAAGLRAADVARAVRKFQTKDVKVAKLFAKHIKLKDSIGFLKSSRTGIAVGTPQRLKDLMDEGSLAVDRLERIVIDASHIDQKRRAMAMAMANCPVISDGNFPAPGCATRCWENTKYVSQCMDKNICLCRDAEYQNSVFKCLYSQCDTAHFGSALHHTITQCVGVADNILLAVPPISNHDSLRRREAEYLRGAKLEDVESIGGYPTLSALPTQSALPLASGIAFSSVPPLQYLTRDTVTAFATASVTSPSDSVQTTYNTAPEFITASPLIYTGNTIEIIPRVPLLLLVAAISGLCLVV